MTKRKDLFWWLAILVVLGSGACVVVASEAGLASLSSSVERPAHYTPAP
jgi:hypothetical protein